MFLTIASATMARAAVNDDNSLPNASAMPDVKSITKGFLMPSWNGIIQVEQRVCISG